MQMYPIILILALASSLVLSTRLSKLSEELLADGLISLEADGLPTTVCMASLKDGTSRIELCPMTEGFGPRSVGCFSVWNGTDLLQQGCYSNQEISMRSQCKKRMCSADGEFKSIAFCCCYGALCNAALT